MAEIRLARVAKVYPPNVVAVDDVSLTIADGELMVLLGPSGCGKSTTLRLIAGLEAATSGDLFIGGRRVNDVDPRDRDLAIVFQNYALYPHMTVEQNLGFGMRLRGVDRATRARRVRETARMLGLEPLLSRRPGALSGGQRQRVALGRALIREPSAFLLDEPLSNLDAQLRSSMRTELIKLHRQLGATIVHVTHDQLEAMTMGERICIMNGGRVVQVGPPREVYRNPADTFVARFLASPPMNLAEAAVTGSAGGGLAVTLGPHRLPLPQEFWPAYAAWRDRPVLLGIRPEDLYERPGEGAARLDLTVEAVETVGPETIVVGRVAGAAELAARLGRAFEAPVGALCPLRVDTTQIHLFDPQSGRRVDRPDLGPGGREPAAGAEAPTIPA